jgi:diguanylate cyclase (GGDEF)-like protein
MSLQRGSFLTTGTAFVVLIALIFGLTLNSLLQLETLGAQIRTIAERHNRKIDLITQTQVASHVRTDRLLRMVLTDDPFERDAHYMEFNRAGFLVGSGRKALREMTLNPEEQRRFDAQTRLVNTIQATQEHVLDLLSAERSAEARQYLILKAVPLQETFNQQLAAMRNQYQEANLAAQQHAKNTYQRTILLTLALGVGALTLALLIAWSTLRSVSRNARQLREHLDALERSRAALHEEATHDPLTGLANRRLFYDRLQQAARHAQRYGGKFGILYVDLDRFKDINDHHGHHVGDAVLTEVAKRLTSSIRDSDTVARLGGDEFAVLLEGIQGREDHHAAALKIEQAINSSTGFYGLNVEISASIGLSLYPDDGDNVDMLLRAADAAMYRVKSGCESGRQRSLKFQ